LSHPNSHIKAELNRLAQDFGFIAVGVSKARRLSEEQNHFEKWLGLGYHGEMQYMENHFDKRLDPTLLVPGSKSVISFLYNYYPSKQQNPEAPKIAKYAWGVDYHKVIKDRLFELIEELIKTSGKIEGRIFVDSAPVMERQWAALSGLGWLGKNSLLLRKGEGSFFFIATLLSDLDLEPDTATTDHCGTCTACIDACPTQAIVADGVIDASKCISYLTIEKKGSVPASFYNQTENWVFGCDICQDVCPWNRFSEPHTETLFQPKEWINWSFKDWEALTIENFKENFSASPLTRAGFEKIKQEVDRNVKP
jgi:epoxyqueuosine reductase